MKMTKTNNDWTVSSEQTVKSSTYSFATKSTYSDGNINLEVQVPGMVLGSGETFYITDPINTWTWNVDANGNVTIT